MRHDRASKLMSFEWIEAAHASGELLDGLLAVASAIREQEHYCPLPPDFRAVYECDDGSLIEEPIVALVSGESWDEPVVCNGPEGFSREGTPDWYLKPGELLADVEHLVHAAAKARRERAGQP
jgi:hypothetical protein